MNCREMLVTFATPLNFGATPAHKMYISSAGGASNLIAITLLCHA